MMYSPPTSPREEAMPRKRLTQPVSKTENGRKSRRNEKKQYTHAHYEPVNHEGEIRLLKLFPSDHEIHQDDYEGMPTILCELVTTTLRKDADTHIPYEALSWCWGGPEANSYINIRKKGKIYAKYVRPDLVYAMHALRHHQMDRYIWIDAICINQENIKEKNHQIEMMAEIYGRAEQVCVWLGVATKSSQIALRFIKKEVLQLRHFDELCRSRQASEKWQALLELMQRPWFSRRWVVQEIALARHAVIHCGNDKISWQKFAVAVELFVEVETATHRLSEVMKKDPKFFHVPGWFEYVSALGASLLVEATGRLFRDNKANQLLDSEVVDDPATESESESGSDADLDSDLESNGEEEEEEIENPGASINLIQAPEGRLLPNQDLNGDLGDSPEDAKDVRRPKGQPLLNLEYLVSSLSSFDTTVEHDNIYALLAISKDTTPKAADRALLVTDHTRAVLEKFTQKKDYRVDYDLPYVDVCKDFIQFCIQQSMRSDPSRALDVICRPWATEQKLLVKRRRMRALNYERTKLKERKALKRAHVSLPISAEGNSGATDSATVEQKKTFDEMPLPSWVPQLSSAPYAMDYKAGVEGLSIGRMNADPLVGMPSLTQRNYNAAETKKLNMKTFKFRKREKWNYYSMFVEGFVLDTIAEVQQSSQGGSIPTEWAEFGDWRDAKGKPPEQLWRTLVADRGKDGKNPPVFYARACKESFNKGSIKSGAISTTDLINNERNSVVAQFCRRVQAVIWNRALVKTEGGTLGLVGKEVKKGDMICVLYGCSVPIVLRRSEKKDEETMKEEMEWELAYLQTWVRRSFDRYNERVRLYERERRKDQFKVDVWKTNRWLAFRSHETWRYKWKQKVERGEIQIVNHAKYRRQVEFNTWLREHGKIVEVVDEKTHLEKWRKGWRPPKVDWEEFRLFQKYGRIWLNIIKKQKEVIQKKAEAHKKRLWEQENKRKARKKLSFCNKIARPPLVAAGLQNQTMADPKGLKPNDEDDRKEPNGGPPNGEFQPAVDAISEGEKTEVKADNDGDQVADMQSTKQGEPEVHQNDSGQKDANHTHPEQRPAHHIADPNSQQATKTLNLKIEAPKSSPPGVQLSSNQPPAKPADKDSRPELTKGGGRKLTAEQSRRLTEKEKIDYDKGVREKYMKMVGPDFKFHYRMLGECYVHGMMDGEAMAIQNQKPDKLVVQVFEMR